MTIPIFPENHEAAENLKIGAVTRFTTIDFPGCISAVLFLKGCPWDCLYCQNQELRRREFAPEEGSVSWEWVEKFLGKRFGLIDGVVFSGGEPCVDPALPDAVRRVKAIGYKIGLHTGGAYPERLKKILPDLDWVGFDVKAPTEKPEVYENVVRRKKVAEKVQESLDALLASGVSYEIRCTAHPDYLSDADLLLITEELQKKGVDTFALQIYRQPPGVDKSLWLERVGSDYPSQEVLDRMQSAFPHFILRRT